MQQLLTELTALMNKHGAVVTVVSINWSQGSPGKPSRMLSAQVEILNLKAHVVGALTQMTLSQIPPPALPDPPVKAPERKTLICDYFAEPAVGAVCDHDWRKRRYDPGHWCTKCPATKI